MRFSALFFPSTEIDFHMQTGRGTSYLMAHLQNIFHVYNLVIFFFSIFSFFLLSKRKTAVRYFQPSLLSYFYFFHFILAERLNSMRGGRNEAQKKGESERFTLWQMWDIKQNRNSLLLIFPLFSSGYASVRHFIVWCFFKCYHDFLLFKCQQSLSLLPLRMREKGIKVNSFSCRYHNDQEEQTIPSKKKLPLAISQGRTKAIFFY